MLWLNYQNDKFMFFNAVKKMKFLHEKFASSKVGACFSPKSLQFSLFASRKSHTHGFPCFEMTSFISRSPCDKFMQSRGGKTTLLSICRVLWCYFLWFGWFMRWVLKTRHTHSLTMPLKLIIGLLSLWQFSIPVNS